MRWFTRAAYGRLVVRTGLDHSGRPDRVPRRGSHRSRRSSHHRIGGTGGPLTGRRSLGDNPDGFQPHGAAGWESLCLDPTTPYFNSGVMVIDVGAWRAARMSQRVLEFVVTHHAALDLADQDAMNAVIRGAFSPSAAVESGDAASRSTASGAFFFPEAGGYRGDAQAGRHPLHRPPQALAASLRRPRLRGVVELLQQTAFRGYVVARPTRREQVAYRVNKLVLGRRRR